MENVMNTDVDLFRMPEGSGATDWALTGKGEIPVHVMSRQVKKTGKVHVFMLVASGGGVTMATASLSGKNKPFRRVFRDVVTKLLDEIPQEHHSQIRLKSALDKRIFPHLEASMSSFGWRRKIFIVTPPKPGEVPMLRELVDGDARTNVTDDLIRGVMEDLSAFFYPDMTVRSPEEAPPYEKSESPDASEPEVMEGGFDPVSPSADIVSQAPGSGRQTSEIRIALAVAALLVVLSLAALFVLP